ncbi:hypothetical protein ADL27_30920, partial [Streptomyces sp. NRRL F-6602]
LLDAALHALVFDVLEGPAQGWLPFSWNGVSVHAVGASSVRLRLSRTDDGTLAIAVTDTAGTPVASVGSLVTRPLSAGQFGGAGGAGRDSLFQLDWAAAGDLATRDDETPGPVAVIGPDTDLLGDGDLLAEAGTEGVTGLADLVTGTGPGEDVPSV